MGGIAGGLDWLGGRATQVLAGGVLIGLALPWLAELLRPLLVPCIIAPFALSLLRIDYGRVRTQLRRPGPLLAVLAFLLAGSALVAWALLAVLPLPAGLGPAIVLMTLAPPITTAAAFAQILRLDAEFSLAAMVGGNLLVPLTLPALALGLVGLELDITAGDLMARLLLVVGGAFALALAARRWFVSAEALDRHSRRLDGAIVAVLILFAIGVMDGVTAVLLAQPATVLLYLACAFAANIALQVLGAALFWWTGPRTALTIGHMTGNCNMAIVLAALADRAPFEVFMYFALAQFPMYMLPALSLPVYRRILARAGGEADAGG